MALHRKPKKEPHPALIALVAILGTVALVIGIGFAVDPLIPGILHNPPVTESPSAPRTDDPLPDNTASNPVQPPVAPAQPDTVPVIPDPVQPPQQAPQPAVPAPIPAPVDPFRPVPPAQPPTLPQLPLPANPPAPSDPLKELTKPLVPLTDTATGTVCSLTGLVC